VSERLDELVDELEATAARLRGGDVEAEEAAALVERCAELAVQVSSELDTDSRAADAGEGQERLL
jgi:uncharacterized protein Yka (UPF0111/DUF47 family)